MERLGFVHVGLLSVETKWYWLKKRINNDILTDAIVKLDKVLKL